MSEPRVKLYEIAHLPALIYLYFLLDFISTVSTQKYTETILLKYRIKE